MKKTKLFSFCNIYIFLWLVYYLQSVVFGRVGTIYSQVIILFLSAVSFYCMVYALMHYKVNPYLKALAVFIALLTVYGLALIVSSQTIYRVSIAVSGYTYLLSLYNSLLPIFPFYVFTRQGQLTRSSLRWWTIFFLVAVLMQYQANQQAALLRAIELPTTLSAMISMAETISADTPFMRVDFYQNEGKAVFGEITFFPAAGLGKFTDEKWDYELGSWLSLSSIKSN